MVDHLKKTKGKAFILKVDFEKAFDSISWDFILRTMGQMGFGSKWCKWIHSCLSTTAVSILVNGSPTSEFRTEKGVRQGDPLSLFLFLIAAEGLNVMLKVAVSKGLAVGRERIHLSHFQYADDTIIFGDWSVAYARNLMRILNCVQKVSGLKINFNKSKLFGLGVQSEVVFMANRMGCEPRHFPLFYLGLPIWIKHVKSR